MQNGKEITKVYYFPLTVTLFERTAYGTFTSASGETRAAPASRPFQPSPVTPVCPKPPSSALSKISPPPAGYKKTPVSEETGQGAAICIC